MSWDMWHEEGWGFLVEDCSETKYVSFIRNHRKSLTKHATLLAAIDEFDGWDDENDGSFFDYIRDITDAWTIAEPIASIMSRETGINFGAPSATEDNEEAVMFFRSYPWEYNKVEKGLTEAKIMSILKQYAKELGVEHMVCWIDLVYSG